MAGGQFSAKPQHSSRPEPKASVSTAGGQRRRGRYTTAGPVGMGGTKRPSRLQRTGSSFTAGATPALSTTGQRAGSSGFLLYQGDNPEMIPVLIGEEWVRLTTTGLRLACIAAH